MTATTLFSENWFRVENLRPRLADSLIVRQHRYRGVPWYVLQMPGHKNLFRVDSPTFELIEMMNGRHSVAEIWGHAIELQDALAPTQQQFERLLGQLHEAGFLGLDGKTDSESLFARGDELRAKELKQRYLNPLYMRFALFDPDTALDRLLPVAGWLLSRPALACWLGLVLLAGTQVLTDWAGLQHEIASFDLFATQNLIALLIVYPLLKLIHELAHGLAVKRYGGEVHELGFALMVLLPIPFVDASAAGAFPEKHRRMLVGAAGILVELGIAALATIIWSATASGSVHDFCLMLMLLGGLSTVLFNGNPLLKFDGYYILADALEIPNLADRARRYLLGQMQSVLLGLHDRREPVLDGREAAWLAAYGVLSLAYRVALLLSIAYLLAGQYFFFGILLAGWVLYSLLLQPLWKSVRFLRRDTGNQRPRALAVSGALAVGALVFLTIVPLPYHTAASGIVWLPETAIIRAAHSCEIEQAFVESGSAVSAGKRLFQCADPALLTELEATLAELDAINAEHAAVAPTDRLRKQLLANERATLKSKVERLRDKVTALEAHAQSTGRFVTAAPAALAGQYVDQGDIIAFVVPERERTIRVAVPQERIEQIDDSRAVAVRLLQDHGGSRIFPTVVARRNPKADYEVSNAALTTLGGGEIAVDPANDSGRRTLAPVFELELDWPADAPALGVGAHVRVRFEHVAAPLAERVLTSLRQAFLGHLSQ